VIPVLLLSGQGLVKTVGFSRPSYVGDPVNTVKIFNEKEVDELVLLDIDASRSGAEPNYQLLEEIVGEAFMPIAYGGGIRSAEQARRLIRLGIEKIVVDSAVLNNLGLVSDIAAIVGSSSTLVAVDIRRDWRGRPRLYDHARRRTLGVDPLDHIRAACTAGAGEILINDVRRDGTGKGMDLDLIRAAAEAAPVPLIACGGAGSLADVRAAADVGASAVGAGSLFVYLGPHRAVMINYPDHPSLEALLR